jgi:hypothetical protein
MAHDPDDPFFDADDLSHNLGATGYELDQEGFATIVGGMPRDEPGDHEGLHLVDEDTLGRGLGISRPDASDIIAAREAELARARRGVRQPSDRSGPDEGVRRVPGPERDAERAVSEDTPRGDPDSAGADHDRVIAYLNDPKNNKLQDQLRNSWRRRKQAAEEPFSGASFGIEIRDMRVLASGAWRLTIDTPAEDRDEVYKLSTITGLLLEASVSVVEGRIS